MVSQLNRWNNNMNLFVGRQSADHFNVKQLNDRQVAGPRVGIVWPTDPSSEMGFPFRRHPISHHTRTHRMAAQEELRGES